MSTPQRRRSSSRRKQQRPSIPLWDFDTQATEAPAIISPTPVSGTPGGADSQTSHGATEASDGDVVRYSKAMSIQLCPPGTESSDSEEWEGPSATDTDRSLDPVFRRGGASPLSHPEQNRPETQPQPGTTRTTQTAQATQTAQTSSQPTGLTQCTPETNLNTSPEASAPPQASALASQQPSGVPLADSRERPRADTISGGRDAFVVAGSRDISRAGSGSLLPSRSGGSLLDVPSQHEKMSVPDQSERIWDLKRSNKVLAAPPPLHRTESRLPNIEDMLRDKRLMSGLLKEGSSAVLDRIMAALTADSELERFALLKKFVSDQANKSPEAVAAGTTLTLDRLLPKQQEAIVETLVLSLRQHVSAAVDFQRNVEDLKEGDMFYGERLSKEGLPVDLYNRPAADVTRQMSAASTPRSASGLSTPANEDGGEEGSMASITSFVSAMTTAPGAVGRALGLSERRPSASPPDASHRGGTLSGHSFTSRDWDARDLNQMLTMKLTPEQFYARISNPPFAAGALPFAFVSLLLKILRNFCVSETVQKLIAPHHVAELLMQRCRLMASAHMQATEVIRSYNIQRKREREQGRESEREEKGDTDGRESEGGGDDADGSQGTMRAPTATELPFYEEVANYLPSAMMTFISNLINNNDQLRYSLWPRIWPDCYWVFYLVSGIRFMDRFCLLLHNHITPLLLHGSSAPDDDEYFLAMLNSTNQDVRRLRTDLETLAMTREELDLANREPVISNDTFNLLRAILTMSWRNQQKQLKNTQHRRSRLTSVTGQLYQKEAASEDWFGLFFLRILSLGGGYALTTIIQMLLNAPNPPPHMVKIAAAKTSATTPGNTPQSPADAPSPTQGGRHTHTPMHTPKYTPERTKEVLTYIGCPERLIDFFAYADTRDSIVEELRQIPYETELVEILLYSIEAYSNVPENELTLIQKHQSMTEKDRTEDKSSLKIGRRWNLIRRTFLSNDTLALLEAILNHAAHSLLTSGIPKIFRDTQDSQDTGDKEREKVEGDNGGTEQGKRSLPRVEEWVRTSVVCNAADAAAINPTATANPTAAADPTKARVPRDRQAVNTSGWKGKVTAHLLRPLVKCLITFSCAPELENRWDKKVTESLLDFAAAVITDTLPFLQRSTAAKSERSPPADPGLPNSKTATDGKSAPAEETPNRDPYAALLDYVSPRDSMILMAAILQENPELKDKITEDLAAVILGYGVFQTTDLGCEQASTLLIRIITENHPQNSQHVYAARQRTIHF